MDLYTLIQQKFKKVFILSGLPGLGKSTFCKTHLSNYFNICKDDIRLFFAQQKYGNLPEYLLQDKLEQFTSYVKYLVPILVELYFNYSFLRALKPNTYRLFINAVTKTMINESLFNELIKYFNYRMDLFTSYSGIVFDACYFTVAQRRCSLQYINKRLPCYCIYFDGTPEQAKQGVYIRSITKLGSYEGQDIFGRTVPDNIIDEFSKLLRPPNKKEGFKEVFRIDKKSY